MSDSHTDVAREVQLDHPVKVVLMILASRACRVCGLTWPGVTRLRAECGMGETRLRDSLEALCADPRGLLRVHAYPRGGRGKATEYVVLPGLMELSTAPCGKCRENQGKVSRRAGFDEGGTEKPPAPRDVSAKPLAESSKTPRTGTDQPEVEHNRKARVRAQAELGPLGLAPSEPPPPTTAQEAVQRVREMTRAVGQGGDRSGSERDP